MALPRTALPEYSTTIPSTGRKIKYSPFTVRDEKMLMSASESQDPDEITNAIVRILEECVKSPDFSVSDLALFDIEYLFLKTRSKSVGEKINLIITDPNDENFSTEHSIYIDKIGVERTEGHESLIDLGDGVKVQMKYPDISFFSEGLDLSNLTESSSVMSRCISSIITDEEVYNSEDLSREELTEWLDGMTSKQFRMILEFFNTMPKLRHVINAKNTNTGKDFKLVLEGLADFF